MDPNSLLVHFITALGAALVGSAVALRFGQPSMVGYILAGVAIGPFTPGIMGDTAAIAQLADVGIELKLEGVEGAGDDEEDDDVDFDDDDDLGADDEEPLGADDDDD